LLGVPLHFPTPHLLGIMTSLMLLLLRPSYDALDYSPR